MYPGTAARLGNPANSLIRTGFYRAALIAPSWAMLMAVRSSFRLQYCLLRQRYRKRVGKTGAQNRVMFAAGGFGNFATLALYSSTANRGPAAHSYISPMLCSSRGSASMLKTLG
jgi:hypothetical protein